MAIATIEDWVLTYSGWLALIEMLASQSLLKYNLFHYTSKIIFYTYILINYYLHTNKLSTTSVIGMKNLM